MGRAHRDTAVREEGPDPDPKARPAPLCPRPGIRGFLGPVRLAQKDGGAARGKLRGRQGPKEGLGTQDLVQQQ